MRGRVLALAFAVSALLAGAAGAAPDALKVVFCGTSGPLPIATRAKACTAVLAGGSLYLFDDGPEATKNLMLFGLPLDRLKAVFITHLHSDHIGDLGETNLQSWVQGRAAPLPVIGPPGVEKLAEGLNEAYAADHGFRHAHHEHGEVKLPIAAGLLEGRPVVLPPPDAEGVSERVVFQDGELKVTAILVNHQPVEPAYGYRIDYKGRAVVISGDTKKWPPLAVASRGADVLIHEAQNAAMTRMMASGLKMLGRPRMSSIMADTLSYHTTPVEAAEIAKAAGTPHLVLTHLTQAGLPFYTPEKFLDGVAAVGAPDVRLAVDGMVIELPVGDRSVVFSQMAPTL